MLPEGLTALTNFSKDEQAVIDPVTESMDSAGTDALIVSALSTDTLVTDTRPVGMNELVVDSTAVGQPSLVIPESVHTPVRLMVKRVGTVLRHLPKGIQISDEAVAELGKMNRSQRRSAVARLKPSEKNKGKRTKRSR